MSGDDFRLIAFGLLVGFALGVMLTFQAFALRDVYRPPCPPAPALHVVVAGGVDSAHAAE